MAPTISLADVTDPDDPQGRTYREVNAEKTHHIPIGSLVELHDGVRLFVVYHGRDCDKTPLYWLSHDPGDTVQEYPQFRNQSWVGGFPEESLKVIQNRVPSGGHLIEVLTREGKIKIDIIELLRRFQI